MKWLGTLLGHLSCNRVRGVVAAVCLQYNAKSDFTACWFTFCTALKAMHCFQSNVPIRAVSVVTFAGVITKGAIIMLGSCLFLPIQQVACIEWTIISRCSPCHKADAVVSSLLEHPSSRMQLPNYIGPTCAESRKPFPL